MAPLFNDTKLIIASHNSGKVGEIRDLLAFANIEIFSAAELRLPEPVENGDTFIERRRPPRDPLLSLP